MRRLLSVFLIFCVMMCMIGCKREDNSIKETDAETTVTPDITKTEELPPEATDSASNEPQITEELNGIYDSYYAGLTEDEIKEKSIQYAEQLVKGKCAQIMEDFSEIMKSYLDEANLQTIWNSTVLLIGEFDSIDKELIQTTLVDEFAVCLVYLKYETNGVQIAFTYNKQLEIDGLHFDYYSINNEDVTEIMEEPDEREIEIHLGSEEHPLSGIVTLPKDVQKPPVVILIQGSGQSDMDETIGLASNKPFRDIARGLADLGIASIRYNKRFFEYPSLADETSTIYDEVLDDASLAIRYAFMEDCFDGDRIYVAGHSLGGMLAPKIADMNEEVKGIISLAGSPRRLEDIIYDQNKELLLQMGIYTEDEINELMEEIQVMVDHVKTLSEETMDEPIFGATGYYWKSLNEIDTVSLVQKSNLPMLFLQGDADFQVYPDVDFALWKSILEGKENVTFHLYENLNHLFMVTNGMNNITDYDIKGSVEQCVIEDMASFILQN